MSLGAYIPPGTRVHGVYAGLQRNNVHASDGICDPVLPGVGGKRLRHLVLVDSAVGVGKVPSRTTLPSSAWTLRPLPEPEFTTKKTGRKRATRGEGGSSFN